MRNGTTIGRRGVVVAAALALAGLSGAYLSAGPLEPPAGPPAPSGPTLAEILDAVQALGNGNGGDPCPAGPRGVLVEISMRSQGGPLDSGVTFPVESLAHALVTPTAGSGQPVGSVHFTEITLTRHFDILSPALRQTQIEARELRDIKVTVRGTNGAVMMRMNASMGQISGQSFSTTADCTGESSAVESISIVVDSLTITPD